MCDAKEKVFVGDRAKKLQTNGQTIGRYAARDRNGWKAAEIGWAIVAQQQRACGLIRAADGGCFFTNRRRGNRRGIRRKFSLRMRSSTSVSTTGPISCSPPLAAR